MGYVCHLGRPAYATQIFGHLVCAGPAFRDHSPDLRASRHLPDSTPSRANPSLTHPRPANIGPPRGCRSCAPPPNPRTCCCLASSAPEPSRCEVARKGEGMGRGAPSGRFRSFVELKLNPDNFSGHIGSNHSQQGEKNGIQEKVRKSFLTALGQQCLTASTPTA